MGTQHRGLATPGQALLLGVSQPLSLVGPAVPKRPDCEPVQRLGEPIVLVRELVHPLFRDVESMRMARSLGLGDALTVALNRMAS